MLRIPSQRPLLARLILCLSCLAVGLSNSWLPLPMATLKDRSVPFPCQDSACGCRSAAQCWSSCCCNTDAEKLAWANRHSVTPPASFLEKMVVKEKSNTASGQCGSCCCASTIAGEKASSTAARGCCQAKPRDSNESESSRTLVIDAVRRCQGVMDNVFVSSVKLFPCRVTAPAVLEVWMRLCRCTPMLASPPGQTPEPMPD